MNKTLIILILAALVLSWNFIFNSSEKVDFTDEAKILQGLSSAISYKTAIRKYWLEKGELPTAEAWQKIANKPAIDISKSLVKTIDVGIEGPGMITVTFTNKDIINVAGDIEGKKITLKPVAIDGRLNWSCSGTLAKELLPKKCQ